MQKYIVWNSIAQSDAVIMLVYVKVIIEAPSKVRLTFIFLFNHIFI